MRIDDGYIEFNEIENTICSIEMVQTLSTLVTAYPSYWKWLIISAHDALQGAIVCAIADSANLNVLSERSAKRMLAFLEGTAKEYPGEWLADFRQLLARAKLKIEDGDLADIVRLHAFRNQFSHFTPMTWSIELSGLPRIVLSAVKALESLFTESAVMLLADDAQMERANRAMAAAKNQLEGLRLRLAVT